MNKSLFFFFLILFFSNTYSQTPTFIPGPEGYGTQNNTTDRGMIPFYKDQNFLYCFTRKTISDNPVTLRTFIVRVNLTDGTQYVYSEQLFTNIAWNAKKLNQYIFFRCGQRLCKIDTVTNTLSIISSNAEDYDVFDHYVIYENANTPFGTHILNLNTNITTEIRSPNNRNLYRLGGTYYHNGVLYFRGAYTTTGVKYSIYKYIPLTNTITEIVGANVVTGSEIYQDTDDVLKVNDNLIFLMKDVDYKLKYYSVNLTTQSLNSSFTFNTGTVYDTGVKRLLLFNNTVYLTNNNNEVYTSNGASVPQLTSLPAFYGIGTNGYSYPFLYLDNVAYTAFYSIEFGLEMWKYDGTLNGRQIVSDITSGDLSSFSNYTNGFVHNNRLFCTVNTGPLAYSLYSTDGTNTGTVSLINNSQFTYISNFVPYNNTLYFYGENGTNKGLYSLDYVALLSNQDFVKDNTIDFYPNPVKSVLNFTETMLEVKISDMNGKTIKSEKNVNRLFLDGLTKGVYLIEFVDGHKVKKQKKVIIE